MPDSTSEVVLTCPTTIGSITGPGVLVKSLRVNNDLRLLNGAGIDVTEDFYNFGVTAADPAPTRGFIHARDLVNGRQIFSVGNVDVTRDILNGGTMIVDGLVEASRHIVTTQSSSLSAGNINAYGDFLNYSTTPLTLTTDLAIGGDFHSQANVQGRNLSTLMHYSGTFVPRTYSGPGVLKFTNAGVGGNNLTIANDKTFEVPNFSISGTLNLGSNVLTVTDNVSFTGTGIVTGNGTIRLAPRSAVNSIFSYNNANFTPTLRLLSGTAVVSGTLFGGPLIIDSGATLAMNSSGLTLNNDLTVNGRLTTTGASSGTSTFDFNGTNLVNNGEISNIAGQNFVFRFNQSATPLSQTISGTGSWSPTVLQLGTPTGGATTITLMNDMTFAGTQMVVNGTFNIGPNTFTHSGSSFGNNGTVNGTGTLKFQPTSGAASISGVIGVGMEIASGTVSTNSFSVGGPLVIDSGATLSQGGTGLFARGNVTINGTLNQTGGTPTLYVLETAPLSITVRLQQAFFSARLVASPLCKISAERVRGAILGRSISPDCPPWRFRVM